MAEKHEMFLAEGKVADGIWECFTCEYTMYLRMEPYLREVITGGNPNALHYGGVGITLEVDLNGGGEADR